MKKITITILVFLVCVLILLCLRPVRISRENASDVNGKICSIYADSLKSLDLVLNICDDDHMYLINRGMEYGPPLEVLYSLVGERIKISYAKHWTPLDPGSTMRQVVEIAVQDSIIYTVF